MGFILMVSGSEGWGQFVYFEDFSKSTAPGWSFAVGDSSPGARLTAGTNPVAADPETAGPIDVEGNGWLRLATETGNQANSAYLSTAIPSSANEVSITFDFAFWGASSGTGADGLVVYLFDDDVEFDSGASGGSLNYAQKTGETGLNGAYIGVGLDVYGNYSEAGEGRTGSDPTMTLGGSSQNVGFDSNEVVVRGQDDSVSQDGTGNYYYLAGTGGKDFTSAGDSVISSLDALNPGNANLAFADQEYRTDQDALDYRRFQLTLDEADQLKVSIEFGLGEGFTELYTIDLSGLDRPENLNIGFGAATGGVDQVYEIRNLLITADGFEDTWYWTDADVGDNRLWSDTDNWTPTSIPGEGSNVYGDVVFSNQFELTSPLAGSEVTIDGGTDKTVGSLFFSGAYGFELTADSTESFIFDRNGEGDSVINILNNPEGNADHIVNLDIGLENDLEIDNLVTQTLTFNGDIDTNGNDIAFDTVGTTVVTGVISGSGEIVSEGAGTVRITGDNTYTGTTTINEGVYQIEHADALGGTGSDTTVNDGGTLALAGGITSNSGESVTIGGVGQNGIGALSNTTGTNTWAGSVDLSDDASIGTEAGTLTVSGNIDGAGNELSFVPASGAGVTVSGVISDSTGTTDVIQSGDGTTTLTANNTYSGETVVENGTLAITNAGALGDTAGDTVVEAGGTLDVSGGLTISSGETYTVTGTGDTGKAAIWASGGTNELDGLVTITGGSASFGAESGAVLNMDGTISGVDQDAIISGLGTVVWKAPNSYTGDTLIQGGTLQFQDGDNRIADSSDIVISSGATLDMNDRSDTVGSIAGAGTIDTGNGTLTFGVNDNNTVFSGDLVGTGNLTKTGAATTIFSGSSGLTGTLTISEGTVEIGADNVFSDSMDVTLAGGTLATDGFANTFDGLTLSADSSINFNSASGGELNFATGTRTGGTLTIDNWSGSRDGNGGTYLQFDTNSLGSLTDNVEFTGWGAGELLSLGGGLYEMIPSLDDFYIWDGSSNGRWNNKRNWQDVDGNGVDDDPDWNGAKVLISDVDSGLDGSTIELRTDIDFGVLVIDNDDTFTISSNNTGHDFFINNNGNQASITTLGSTTPTIARELRMEDDLLIQNNSTGTLTITDSASSGHDIRTDGNTIIFDGSGLTVIDSQITEGGSLTKKGTGTLELNDNNTYSGGSTIENGTTLLGNDNALGSGTITIEGGTLAANGADRTLNETYVINGDFTVGNDDGRDLTFSGNGSLGAGSQSVTVEGGIDFTLSGDVTGSGAFVKEGAGTAIFEGDNSTFSGGLAINAGRAEVDVSSEMTLGGVQANENYLGTGNILVNSGGILDVDTTQGVTIASGGTLSNAGGTTTIDVGTDFTVDGSLVHTGGVTTVNAGDDLLLGGAGVIEVSGGIVNLNGSDDFSTGDSGAEISVTNGGELNVDLSTGATASNFDLAENDTITVDGSSSELTVTTENSGGTVTVDGNILVSDGGRMTVAGGSTVLSDQSRLDGGTATSKGTLEVRGDLTMAGDTEVVNAPNITFAIEDGASAIDAVFDGAAGSTNIENLGVVTKTGTGVLELGSNLNNIQAQVIDLEGGTLLLSTSDQIANNTDMILSGGTWDTDGNDEVLGSLTLSGNSAINLGDGDSVVEFAASSGEGWTDDVLVINEWSGDTEGGGTDQIYFGTNGAGLTGSQLDKIFFVNPAGRTGTFGARILPTGEIVPVVPEPKAYVMVGALILFMGFHYYRRKGKIKAQAGS